MFFNGINKRIKVLFLMLFLCFMLIILRVFYVQVIDYGRLSNLANDLWSRNLEIEADRGKIYDRNGNILADNLTTASLVFVPSQIKDKEAVARDISKILNVEYEEIYRHVSKKTSIERVHPEGRKLSNEIADMISKLKYDGVYLVKEAKRYYPYGDLLSHTLGYVGIDNQGLSGIEFQYNSYLTGTNGAIKYFSNAHGEKIKLNDIYIPPTSGINITLTIDLSIQQSIERELDNIRDMFDPDMALAIVVNPKNGEVLGMGSYPDYDPNNYKDYSTEILSRNLPIWASYEPGSTFKIVTTLLGV